MPVPNTVAEIDWSRWRPTDRATLIFVFREREGVREALLIRKKRGLGAGKVNGPGGRIEPGESPAACALRELQEELHVTARNPTWWGRHSFQFVDGYSLHCEVFSATEFSGTATETDEAVPLWTPVTAMPYDEMWADDRLWLPHLLAGRRFEGRWIFDGDAMIDYHLATGEAVSPPPQDGGR